MAVYAPYLGSYLLYVGTIEPTPRVSGPDARGTKGRGHIVRRLAIALAALLVTATPAHAARLSSAEHATLLRYTAAPWRSFDLMADARTGLPADNVTAGGQRGAYASPTNIGA